MAAKRARRTDDSWQRYEVRAFKIAPDSMVVGKAVGEVEAMFPDQARMYVVRIRHGGTVEDATTDHGAANGDDVASSSGRENKS